MKMGDLIVQICAWDDNYVEITDRSGNQIWLKYADIIVLKTLIKTFMLGDTKCVNAMPVEEARQ